MGKPLHIVTPLHKATNRDYLARMTDDKVACMRVAKRYDRDYWDGDRKYGYGGYKYDGRQSATARALIEAYNLKPGARILDVGCGKGFLLYELLRALPRSWVRGFDISSYAIENAKEEAAPNIFRHDASSAYPFQDKEFDLVISITTLHNLRLEALERALKEIERVGKNKYIAVESYRDEKELFNLQCWALTCETFLSPDAWIWFFGKSGYTGDYEFIYFE
jgi:SAM-dependent methyltransferase